MVKGRNAPGGLACVLLCSAMTRQQADMTRRGCLVTAASQSAVCLTSYASLPSSASWLLKADMRLLSSMPASIAARTLAAALELSCSHRPHSTALRARQKSISASGPLPSGSFSDSRCMVSARVPDHATTVSCRASSVSGSLGAAARASLLMAGMGSTTSPRSCCSACLTWLRYFCMLFSSSRGLPLLLLLPPPPPPAPLAAEAGSSPDGEASTPATCWLRRGRNTSESTCR